MKQPASKQPVSPREQGQSAEALAAAYFVQHGYRIRAHNFVGRQGEIDLIVEKGSHLVFVEVRFRTSTAFGTPFDTVTREKCRRLSLAAMQYLTEQRLVDRFVRFDVVSILKRREGPRIEHIEDAFEAELGGNQMPVLV